MPHPWSVEVKACPYPQYDAWREQSSVVWNDEMRAWLVLGYDEALQVLDDHKRFSSNARASNSVFDPDSHEVATFPSLVNTDEPRHKKLRAVAAKAFTPKSIDRDWTPRIKRIVEEQLAGVGRGVFNVIEDLAYPLPVRMIAEVIGIESSRYRQFKAYSDYLAQRTGVPDSGPEQTAEGQQAKIEVTVYFLQQMELRRTDPRDDLFTRILEAEIDGERLTLAEVLAFLVLLLVAGNETTTNLITHAVRALAENRPVWDAVQADRSLVGRLIEETLRWEAPIQGFYRRATEDVELGGALIKRGDPLCVLFGAANRDPKKYDCPEEVRLDRSSLDHLAFGKGIHYCLGASLARIEADIALNAVLDHFEWIAPVEGYEVKWRNTPFFRGPVEYPVTFRARARAPA